MSTPADTQTRHTHSLCAQHARIRMHHARVARHVYLVARHVYRARACARRCETTTVDLCVRDEATKLGDTPEDTQRLIDELLKWGGSEGEMAEKKRNKVRIQEEFKKVDLRCCIGSPTRSSPSRPHPHHHTLTRSLTLPARLSARPSPTHLHTLALSRRHTVTPWHPHPHALIRAPSPAHPHLHTITRKPSPPLHSPNPHPLPHPTPTYAG